MKKDKFFEKYKNPRWQKRRLEKMQEAGFMCEECGDNESTLNVHHKYYIQGNEPWEYDDLSLVVYCESCHNSEHESKKDFEFMLIKLKKYFNFCELSQIFDGLIGEFENFDTEDHIIPHRDFIIKGVRSGLLKNIGKAIFNAKAKTRKEIKEENTIEQ